MADVEALDWVFHQQGRGEERAPIYSIDWHPDGTRFATAANEVKIWSTTSLKAFGEPASEGSGSDEDGEDDSGSGSDSAASSKASSGKKGGGRQRPRSSASSSSGLSSDSDSDDDSDDDDYDEDEEEDGDDEAGEVDLGEEDSRARRKREKKAAKKRAKAAAAAGGQETRAGAGQGIAKAPAAAVASSSSAAAGGGAGGPPIPDLMRARMMAGGGIGSSTLGFGNGGGGSDKENGKGAAGKKKGPAQPAGRGQGQGRQLLAVLGRHEGAVNCVRWSHKGKYLASASDDRSILLWELKAEPATAAFGEAPGTENAENWTVALTCAGHELDVVHVDWAADDSLLASASLDNKVMIWAVADGLAGGRRLLRPIHTLEGHEGPVKGVAWDPVGKYLASAGDDRALLVWRTADWGLEARVAKPFQETAKQETMFRRIAWSPGGDTVVATNASVSKKHVAHILKRAGAGESSKGEAAWLTDITLVGHDQRVTTTRFAPVLFQPKPKDGVSRARAPYSLIATGDEGSGSLSVWSSKKDRAVLVAKECFKSAVTDFAWSKDWAVGKSPMLLACSRDGTAVCVAFDRSELLKQSGGGRPMTEQEFLDFFSRTYGCKRGGGLALGGGGRVLREAVIPGHSGHHANGGGGGGSYPLLSSPVHSQQSQSQLLLDSPAPAGLSSPAASIAPPGGVNVLQPRPKDGAKRRIPSLLVRDGAGGGSVASLPSSRGHQQQQAPASFTSKRARTDAHGGAGGGGGGGGSGPAGAVTVVMFEAEGGGTLEIPCPYAARPGALTRIVTDFAGFGVGMGMGMGVGMGEEDGGVGGYFMEEEDGGMGMGMGMGMGLGQPRLPVVLDCQVEEGGAPGLGPWPMSSLRASRGGQLLWREVVPGRVTTLCGNATVVASGCQDGSIHLYGATGLRLCPPLVMGGGGVALLECTHSSTQTDNAQGAGAGAGAGGGGMDESGEDGEEGGEAGDKLAPEAMYLMAISKAGEVRVWDLYRMRAVAAASLRALFASLQHLLALPATATASASAGAAGSNNRASSPRITRAKVLKGGVPCLEVAVPEAARPTNASSKGGTVVLTLVYDTGMEAWMRVGDSRYALSDFAALSAYSARGGGGAGAVTMSVVMRGEQERVARAEVTRAHLDSRLASAILLNEPPATVTAHLKALVARLVRDDDAGRLAALCDRLLGRRGGEGVDTTSSGSGSAAGQLSWWRPERRELVAGLRKRAALAEVVLPLLTTAVGASGGGGGGAGSASASSSRASAAVQRVAKQYHDALTVAAVSGTGGR